MGEEERGGRGREGRATKININAGNYERGGLRRLLCPFTLPLSDGPTVQTFFFSTRLPPREAIMATGESRCHVSDGRAGRWWRRNTDTGRFPLLADLTSCATEHRPLKVDMITIDPINRLTGGRFMGLIGSN